MVSRRLYLANEKESREYLDLKWLINDAYENQVTSLYIAQTRKVGE